ncbi:MAG: phosphatase PAP2 family protein [Rhodospirillales bacterium]|nr:phosphatase PAP2 family protein [Rhodospirillales bacterium]
MAPNLPELVSRSSGQRVGRLVRWTLAAARQELALLALLALLAASLWAFIAISEEVVEGDTHAIDETILLSLRAPGDQSDPLGPGWVEEWARDLTALGSVGVLTLITVASVIYLVLSRKHRTALFVATAIASGTAISFALKAGFDRPRPDLVPHETIVYTTSFPSAHSMMSALVYLTLGALVARLQPRRRLKAYLLLLAILVTVIVGMSRVYLGVHWPTDVLAGWVAGATWAMLSWAIAAWLQRLHKVESSAGDGREP